MTENTITVSGFATQLRLRAGAVRVLGLDPIADRAAVRRRTGVLLQRSGFVAERALESRGEGFLPKTTSAVTLAQVVRIVHAGDGTSIPSSRPRRWPPGTRR